MEELIRMPEHQTKPVYIEYRQLEAINGSEFSFADDVTINENEEMQIRVEAEPLGQVSSLQYLGSC